MDFYDFWAYVFAKGLQRLSRFLGKQFGVIPWISIYLILPAEPHLPGGSRDLSSLMPSSRDLPSQHLWASSKIFKTAGRREGRSLLLGMREDRSMEPPVRCGRKSCWQDYVTSARSSGRRVPGVELSVQSRLLPSLPLVKFGQGQSTLGPKLG